MEKVWPNISGEILKWACDGHFSIPWGHGRGFVNGSEATGLHTDLTFTRSQWYLFSESRLRDFGSASASHCNYDSKMAYLRQGIPLA